MPRRLGFLIAVLLASVGCDGLVKARVKVVSTQREAIPDALIRHERSADHPVARFTDAKGCAFFSGVVAPVRHVAVTVGKPGYQTHSFRLRTGQDNCLLVRLAAEGENGTSALDILAPQDCPCDSDAGYSPTLSARFRVTGANGDPVPSVAVHRSDRPRPASSQVTDARGCLGVRWIVSPDLRRVPLVLDKSGFQPAQVEVPTMADACYGVTLSPAGAAQASSLLAVSNEQCGCEMFSGRIVWPEK